MSALVCHHGQVVRQPGGGRIGVGLRERAYDDGLAGDAAEQQGFALSATAAERDRAELHRGDVRRAPPNVPTGVRTADTTTERIPFIRA